MSDQEDESSERNQLQNMGQESIYTNKRIVNLMEDQAIEDELAEEIENKKSNYRKNRSMKVSQHDIDKEMKVLKEAHTVLLNRLPKQGDQEKKQLESGKQNVKGLQESYNDFLNYQDVRQMIEDLVLPMAEQIPGIKKVQAEQQRTMANIQTTFRNVQRDIKDHTGLLTGLNTIRAELGNHANQLAVSFDVNKDRHKQVENRLHILTQQNVDQTEDMHKFRSRLSDQDYTIQSNTYKIDSDYKKLQKLFDTWFSDIDLQMKAIEKRLRKNTTDIEYNDGRIVEIKDSIDTKVKATVRDIYEKYNNDDAKFRGITDKFKQYDTKITAVQKLCNNIHEFSKKINKQDHIVKFISHTLPVLTHFQICEALDQVCGREFSEQFHKFEQMKSKQLDRYTKDPKNFECIEALTVRMKTFMNYAQLYKQPILPFNFEHDFDGFMAENELRNISHNAKTAQTKRMQEKLDQDYNFKEALQQCQKPKNRQSTQVMNHKIKKLEPWQLLKLRDSVTILKIKDAKLPQYNDIVKDAMDLFSEQQEENFFKVIKDYKMQEEQKMVKKTSMGLSDDSPPQQIYVMQRDTIRQFQRLDKKYQKLINTICKDLKDFKDQEIKNFASTTEIVMTLNSDNEVIKQVIQDLNEAQTETTHILEEKTEKLESRNTKLFHKIEVCENRIIGQRKQLTADILKCSDKQFDLEQRFKKTREDLDFLIQKCAFTGIAVDQLTQTVDEKFVEVQNLFEQTHKKIMASRTISDKQVSKMMSMKITENMSKEDGESLMRDIEQEMSESHQFNTDGTFTDSQQADELNEEPAQLLSEIGASTKLQRQGTMMITQRKKNLLLTPTQKDSNKDQSEKNQEQKSQKPTLESKEKTAQKQKIHGEKQRQTSLTDNAKEKEKRQKKQRQEQKKRDEEITLKRKLEREEKEEREKTEKAELAAEAEKIRVAEEKRKQVEEEMEIQRLKKEAVMAKFKKTSAVITMGAGFMHKLGDQQVKSEVQNAKMNEKIEATSKAVPKPQQPPSEKKIIEDKKAKDQGDFDDVEEAAGPAFDNPFEAMLKSNQGLDKEAVFELLEPKFEEVFKRIQESETTMKFTVKESSLILDTKMDKNTIVFDKMSKEINQSQAKIKADLEEMLTDNLEFQKDVRRDINFCQEELDAEKKNIVKHRQSFVQDVSEKIKDMAENHSSYQYEFRRINQFVEHINEQIHIFTQDSVLMQMMQEQEVFDRKNIALYGQKTNTQILGKNHYNVNLTTSEQQSVAAPNMASTNASVEKSGHQEFWDLRNKKKDYSQVVKTPQNKSEYAGPYSSLISSISQDRKTAYNQDLDIVQKLVNGAEQSRATPLIEKYYDSGTEYNTLTLDRKCASCMTGFAPQLLSLCKLACLNYQNSPIKYGNHSEQLSLSFIEVLQIKEYLLQKIQANQVLIDQIMQENPSNYGILGRRSATASKIEIHIPQNDKIRSGRSNTRTVLQKEVKQQQMQHTPFEHMDQMNYSTNLSPVSVITVPDDTIDCQNSITSADMCRNVLEQAVSTHENKIQPPHLRNCSVNKYEIEVLYKLMQIKGAKNQKQTIDSVLQQLHKKGNPKISKLKKVNTMTQRLSQQIERDKRTKNLYQNQQNTLNDTEEMQMDAPVEKNFNKHVKSTLSSSMGFQNGILKGMLKSQAANSGYVSKQSRRRGASELGIANSFFISHKDSGNMMNFNTLTPTNEMVKRNIAKRKGLMSPSVPNTQNNFQSRSALDSIIKIQITNKK